MEFASVIDRDEARIILRKRLKKQVKDLRMTYVEIGEKLDMSPSSASDLINARYFPSLNMVFKLAAVLSIKYTEITDGLELFIRPRGYKIKSGPHDLTDEYGYFLRASAEYNTFIKTNSVDVEQTGNVGEGHQYPKLLIEDASMSFYGLHEGLVINYRKDADNFVNGEVYVVSKGDELKVRRVWKCKDRIILIPFSIDPKYMIEEYPEKEIVIEGQIVSVIYKLS